MTNTDSSLTHKERTLQDIFDEMTPEQKGLQATIVGAVLEDEDLSNNPEIINAYLDLTIEQKRLVDFVAGNVLAKQEELEHSELEIVDNFLAHFGVKGMKWGVIRDKSNSPGTLSRSAGNTSSGRQIARGKVMGGGATLAEAHLAGLKSTGHRAINALTGDKKFWRNMAITAGISVGILAAGAAAPFVLPASALASVGSLVAGSSGVAGYVLFEGSLVTLSSIGGAALTTAGATGAAGALGIGAVGNVVGNTVRAVTGNAQINKSYASLGKAMADRQTQGSKRVRKTLNQSGSLKAKDLKHEESQTDAFLAHYGVKGMKWGVKKDVIGVTSLQGTGSGMLVSGPAPTPKESADVMAHVGRVQKALVSQTTGPLRRGGEIPALHEKYKAGKGPIKDVKVMTKYRQEVEVILNEYAKAQAPAGADARVVLEQGQFTIYVGKTEHLDDLLKHYQLIAKAVVKLILDDDGFIVGFGEAAEPELVHGQNLKVDDFLAHYADTPVVRVPRKS